MGLCEIHIHPRFAGYPYVLSLFQCSIQTHWLIWVKRRELNLLCFRIFFIQSRLSIPEKFMSRYPARLILCFLLKFITYTTHFCTFVCNIIPTRLSLPKSTQLLKTPLSSQENLVIQALTQILCTGPFSVRVRACPLLNKKNYDPVKQAITGRK